MQIYVNLFDRIKDMKAQKNFENVCNRGGFKMGAGDPPVIFDIFDSGFYITYRNYTSKKSL
jgi:hypothetical protein